MKKRLLVVGLLLVIFASVRKAYSQLSDSAADQAQLANLEKNLHRWGKLKARARKLTDRELKAIAKDPRFDAASFKKPLSETWSIIEKLEKEELERTQNLQAKIKAKIAMGLVDQKQAAVQSDAVTELFQLRMYFLYGYMIPQILDEGVLGEARKMSGPDWKLEITPAEMRFMSSRLKSATEFSPQELGDGIEKLQLNK